MTLCTLDEVFISITEKVISEWARVRSEKGEERYIGNIANWRDHTFLEAVAAGRGNHGGKGAKQVGLRPLVESWDYPEVEYLGFLNDPAYTHIMQQVDACLVLQKPDHLFSLGSFPSKIDQYAKYNKPIFILKEDRDWIGNSGKR